MNIKSFMKTLEYLNDPNWSLSLGEDTNKIHFRNKHYHVLIETGTDSIHYDEIDPHESIDPYSNICGRVRKEKKF